MATPILLTCGKCELHGQLNDSPTAKAIAGQLPLKIRMSRWGEEYYGSLPKNPDIGQAADAREVMVVGSWRTGRRATPCASSSAPRPSAQATSHGRPRR